MSLRSKPGRGFRIITNLLYIAQDSRGYPIGAVITHISDT
jgi:hypothetical protein